MSREYVGHLIEQEEADRREPFSLDLSYLFKFEENDDKAQLVDAGRAGSKLKFINESRSKEETNCMPKIKTVGGELRIGYYAIKDIEKDAELLTHYGSNFTW
ncbi:Histone-lysine N-methyltransferase ezh1 [Thoreauomyces humboldtii]|nr:Histone-lysine N-methyltransferase ezh1 [Thoreauomyces humboldtii]